jgi:hypothetical protein
VLLFLCKFSLLLSVTLFVSCLKPNHKILMGLFLMVWTHISSARLARSPLRYFSLLFKQWHHHSIENSRLFAIKVYCDMIVYCIVSVCGSRDLLLNPHSGIYNLDRSYSLSLFERCVVALNLI